MLFSDIVRDCGLGDDAAQRLLAAIDAIDPEKSEYGRAFVALSLASLLLDRGAPSGVTDNQKLFVFIDFLRSTADMIEERAGPEVADMGRRFRATLRSLPLDN
jgi:hypothetical protein